MIETIVNTQTGEITERELTAEEIADLQTLAQQQAAEAAAQEAAAAKKAATLAALAAAAGLDPDDVAQVLGV